MKKMLKKLLALLILIELAGINFLADAVYASNMLMESSQSKGEEIVFQANINNTNNTIADIEGENNLNINLSLKGEGFLKDVRILLNGNNYQIAKTADEINQSLMGNNEITNVTKIIKSIDENEIYLKEIDKGEELNVILPIKFVKKDFVKKEDLETDSTITLISTYIDGQNKESQETREIKQHLKWSIKAEEEVSQKIVRYLKYDNRTMVSFEVADGIKDNRIPVINKEINIQVPTINNQMPETITVVGENITNEENNGVLKVTKTYEENVLGEYSWISENKFTVTYLYKTQTDSTKIQTSANAKVTTISGDTIEAKSLNNEFNVNAEVGSMVQFDTKVPNELGKGYLYTNLNRENNKLDTPFNVNHTINIGLANLTDKIILEENNYTFNNENTSQSAEVTNYITTKKVGIVQDELINILGEDGKIIVRDSNLNEIGTLDKNKDELEVNSNRLVFELSNPQKEGLINIYEIKAINGENDFSVEDLLGINSLTINSKITGFNNGTTITNDEKEAKISFTEPTSNASVDISTENLSTVTPNNDVAINIVLNTTDVNDALYIDPVVRVNFPEEITSITPKSAKIIYDDQLVIDQIETVDRSLVFNLKGVQNKYNSLNTTKGTLLQIIADLGVNNLAPSNQTKITVDYLNNFNSESKTMEKNINILAPYGMITTNQIDIDDQTSFAMLEDTNLLKIKNDGNEKDMQITGQVVNNTGADASEFSIVGRIPTKGNKKIDGTDLESTIDTSLASPIEVTGLENCTVYYSTNIDEKVDGNGWTNQATNDSKSFKIVPNGEVNNKQYIKFNYTVKVPENLEFDKAVKENFGVYYTENKEQGGIRRTAESKTIGFETGKPSGIVMGVSAVDTNEGFAINNGDEVKQGQYISYRIKLSNIGSETANEVALTAALPEDMTLIIPETNDTNGTINYYRESTSKLLLQDVGSIKGGENVTYEFTVRADGDSENNDEKLPVSFSVIADVLGENPKSTQYTLNCKSGFFGIKLSSDAVSPIEENQEITYLVSVNNANKDEKTNTKVRLKLPDGLKYNSIDSKYSDSVEYDEENNDVIVNLGTLKGFSKENISISTTNINDNIEELSTEAEITCDGLGEEIKSNKVEFTSESSKAVIQAVQTTNEDSVLDDEEIEFYIDITNTGSVDRKIQFKDNLPKEIGISEYRITKNGELISSGNVNNIDEKINIQSNSTVRVMIKAKPYPLGEGEQITIENTPSIVLADGTNLVVNTKEIIIYTSYASQTQEELNQEATEEKIKTYTISGNVWLDSRNDGARDAYEDIFRDMTVKLFDATNNRAILDETGEEVTAETNEYGEYKFNGLLPGNYYVVALFNDEIYEIAEYRADSIDESLNSDFVGALLDEANVAATDIISIVDSNINNIDLGLIKKEIFDLAIDQTVNKISVASDNNSRTIEYDNEIAKVELTSKEMKDSTSVVEYNIKISNNGDVAGFAKSIMNYVPSGMTFNSQMNPDWYQTKDGILHCVSIADDLIQPGESRDIKLILTKKNGNNELGLTRGRSEIGTTYNEQGLKEINAQSSLFGDYESNVSASNIITLKKSRVKVVSVITISVVLIGLIGLAGFEVKKKVLDKMYNIEDLD